MAFADEIVNLYGAQAEVKFESMSPSSQFADDGWTWRQDSEWQCKKYFNSEIRAFAFECYHK